MVDVIADLAERKNALVPERSFIIQAPAGSGKTGLLIQRYLKLLSLVDAPEEIIAITFTRKAAVEMQNRILAALEQATAGETPTAEHEKITHDLALAVLKRDQQQQWQISDNPCRLRIQTIDALCASLSRQMPLLAKLGTQPETLEDATPLYQQAAINTLAELESDAGWSQSIADLVLHLDNDLPRIKNLIVDMLGKRDQWLRHVTLEHDRDEMEQALANLIEEQLATAVNLFPTHLATELIPLLQFAATNLFETDAHNLLVCCKELAHLPAARVADLNQWRSICGLLLVQNGHWRKQFTVKNGFPPASGNKLEAEVRKRRKAEIQGLITELQKIDGLQLALKNISELPAPNYLDPEWLIVKALCDLLKMAAGQLRLIFAERNQMDFMGIAESALMALGPDEHPADLARTLDQQITHMLVDEFQDISVNQYFLIKNLTREWSLDDGRSLFLVGDPMQSIYRFREAEVSIFIRTFHERLLGHIPLHALRLKVNFRSQHAVVDWINKSFDRILPGQDNIISGAVSFSQAVAHDQGATNNNVTVYPLYAKDCPREAQHTVGIIEKIKQHNKDDSIAILVRSRAHLADIIPMLRKAGIDFSATDIEGLGTQAAIQDLLALTRAWLYQSDRVAWLSCLRAPWCGLSIDALHQLCHQQRDKTLWQCINDVNIINQLDVEDKNRLAKFSIVFHEALAQKQRLSMRDSIESLWCRLGGPATLLQMTDLDNCEVFFSLLGTLDQGGNIDDVQQLTDQVEQLYAAPDQQVEMPVQIMTIHKAKGLEFDHVILPGLGRSTRANQHDLLVWLLRQGKQQQELILAPIREAGEQQSPIYDYINKVDRDKQYYEDARLLYVATTRAKKTLHLMGHADLKEANDELVCMPQKRSLLAQLWPVTRDVFEKHQPQQLSQSATEPFESVNQENRRLTDSWRMPAAPPAFQTDQTQQAKSEDTYELIEFEWAGETIKYIGSVVHNALQRIAEDKLEDWPVERIKLEQKTFEMALQQLGVPTQEQKDAVECVMTALANMLEDERGRWILSDHHQEQKNEYALSGVLDGRIINVVLDRTFVDEGGTRWIVDYKTSRHDGANLDAFLDREQERYQEQLEKYALLMHGLGETNIKLGLYFPLLRGWREWAHAG